MHAVRIEGMSVINQHQHSKRRGLSEGVQTSELARDESIVIRDRLHNEMNYVGWGMIDIKVLQN